MNSRSYWIAISVMFVLGLLIRLTHLHNHSFTSDEAYELANLSTSISEVASAPDGFPPLFRWLISFAHPLTGDSLSRLGPAVFGAISVIVVGQAGRIAAGNTCGITSALVTAISAHQIDFSQQCRAYSLYILLIAISMLSFLQLRKSDSLMSWVYFLTSSSLALGTHYFASIYIVQIWMFLFALKYRTHLSRFSVAAVVFTILCLPWVYCLQADLGDATPIEVVNRFDLTGFAYTYLTAIEGWTIGPSQVELVEHSKLQGIIAVAPWALFAFGSTATLVWHGISRFDSQLRWLLVCLFLATPLLGGLVAVLINTSYVGRYVAWIAVPLALLVGAGMQWQRLQLRTVATYGFIAINLLSTYNRIFVDKYDRENYRKLAQCIADIDPKATVVVMSHYMTRAVKRELAPTITFVPISIGSNEPDDWHERLVPLCREEQGGDPEEDLNNLFIVTEWLPQTNLLYGTRQIVIDGISAQHFKRISGTIEVYRAKPEELCRWLKLRNSHKPYSIRESN